MRMGSFAASGRVEGYRERGAVLQASTPHGGSGARTLGRVGAIACLAVVSVAVSVAGLAGCAAQHPAPPQERVELPVFPPPPEPARLRYERALRTSADVEREERRDSLRRYLTGESRIGEALAKPYGVAVDHGRVFVADTVRRAVFLFDTVGGRTKIIGGEEPGRVLMPLGVDVAGGELYVVDASRHSVLVYDFEGVYRREFGDAKTLTRPAGIAVTDVNGQRRAYVVDTGGVSTADHRVVAFDATDGRRLFEFGTRGTKDGEFNLPRDVAVAPTGELYVVDGGNFRVQVFDADGTFVRAFGDVGRQGGQFSRPKELAVAPDGNVYVVDAAFGNFQIFAPDGRLLLDVGYRSNVDRPAGFMLPAGIAIDVDGRVYVADQYFRKIEIFSIEPNAK